MTYEINHASVISRAEIGEFLDYYTQLKADSEDTDLTDEDRASFLDEYQDYDESLVLQLQEMYDDSHWGEDFISEKYWEDYAGQVADDVVLVGVDQIIKDCFNYNAWSDIMIQDYTEWVYDDVSYYSLA